MENVDKANYTKFLDFYSKEDVDIKIASLTLLPKIIKEIGENKLDELLTFVLGSIDEEDSLLIIDFLKIIKELSSYKNCLNIKLLPLVELGLISSNLACRNEALISFQNMMNYCFTIKDYDPYEFISKFTLNSSTNYKIAFILTLPIVINNISHNNKIKAINYFKIYSRDCNDTVRKVIVLNLKEYISFLNEEIISYIYNNFLEMENDFVKIYIIESILSYKNHPNVQDYLPLLYKVVLSLSVDVSWRVRYSIAENMNELLSFCTKNQKKDYVIKFGMLLSDKEENVRNICVKKLGQCLEIVKDNEEISCNLIESFEKMIVIEESSLIKETLAENLDIISKNCPQSKIKTVIIPICQDLIKHNNDLSRSFSYQTNINSKTIIGSPNIDSKSKPKSPIINPKVLNENSKTKLENYLGKNSNEKKKKSMVYDNSGVCHHHTKMLLTLLRKIPLITKYTGFNFESNVINNFTHMYGVFKWKNKVKLIEVIEEIYSYFSNKGLSGDILNILLKGLQENVFIVREVSCKCLAQILSKIHSDDVNEKVISIINVLKKSINYQMRKTAANFCIYYLGVQNNNDQFISNFIVPILNDDLLKDKTSNMKVICCKIVKLLICKSKNYENKYTSILETLTKEIS